MNPAESLLTRVESGTILPSNVPDFVWDAATCLTESGGSTLLGLWLGDSYYQDAWETTQRTTGWLRLATLDALRRHGTFAGTGWDVRFHGWEASIAGEHEDSQVSIHVDDLATVSVITTGGLPVDWEDWNSTVAGWIDYLLDDTCTD